MQKFLVFACRNIFLIEVFLLVFGFVSLRGQAKNYTHDIIIVGEMGRTEGLGKIVWTLHDAFHNKFSMLMIHYHDLNPTHRKHLRSKILFCATQRGETNEHPNFCDMLPRGDIMIAYSVLETSRAPQHWVERFNTYFDAVVVADQFLVKAYQDSGITTPIFVLPHGFDLERFMLQPIKQSYNKPFVFGMTGAFHQARKNPELLVKAFAKAFKDRPDVQLKIHTKGPWTSFCDYLAQLIRDLRAPNIRFNMQHLSEQEYVHFLQSLDCYVLVSAGEGYSITPREALALGVPCILSDTTSHITICQTGYIRGVPCTVARPGIYPSHPVPIGTQYSPTEEAVVEALVDVYENRDYYLGLARQARPWLEQYCDLSLAPRFLTLFQPPKVLLGDKNEITDQYLMTTSQKLYDKYVYLKGQQ